MCSTVELVSHALAAKEGDTGDSSNSKEAGLVARRANDTVWSLG